MTEAPGREPVARSELRRRALAEILGDRAVPILERTVAEALRATNFVGLGKTIAARYLAVARDTLPLALGALRAADAERSRLLDEYAQVVSEIVHQGVPTLAQRGLVVIGFRLARDVVREHAAYRGYDADELEDELRVFQRAFEARLF